MLYLKSTPARLVSKSAREENPTQQRLQETTGTAGQAATTPDFSTPSPSPSPSADANPCQPSAAAIKLQETCSISRSRLPQIARVRVDDDMKAEAVAASKSVSRSSSTVAFSWEQEPGVSKHSPAEARTKAPTAVPGASRAVVSRRTPASARKQAPETAHPHRLRVPPPPGGPGAPAASPPGRRNPRSSRRVRPADDPFLAAYLACCNCTEDSASRGAQKLLGWAGLGLRLGLGLGPRGLGMSCKSSCGTVEECVVRLAKIPGIKED